MRDRICHKLAREGIKDCMKAAVTSLLYIENTAINSSANSLVCM